MTAAGPIIHDPRQRRTILVGVCLALMAVIASVSGLNVAQPQLALAFAASQSDVLWMINIYTITMAALLLPLGAVGDRWGRKPVLITGLAVFGAASAAAGLATTTGVMLAARFLSGIGAAMISARAIANEGHPYSKALFRSAQESFVHGWQQAMWAGVIVMSIVLVYVLVRGPEGTSSQSPGGSSW
jgi:MFS family permease